MDDEATRLLMESFFTNLLQGKGKAEALQLAQKSLRERDEKYRHPYYWAAFVLTGDPGPLSLK
ncbi:MAG: CHAT domain-containing protein [Pyrinomonadaceae bacterium]